MSSHLYGTLTRDGDHWIIAAEPHVIIRLKRLFGRARNNTVGKLRVKAAPDISEDLEWVLTRWPLAISDPDRRILTREADTARQRIFDVQRILAGYTRPVGNRTPTRPFRDYQLVAGNLAHTTGRLLLTDDLGLGKTTSAATLFRDPATLPAVVVAPTHLATPGRRDDGQPRSQWARELLESFPDLNIHVAKTGKPPTNLDPMPDVIVLNYHKLTGWADWLAAAGVRTVIFDEVQELRRSQSRKYQSAAALARHCLWRLGLSATPIYNYGGELWNVMNVIAPDELGTREEFGREWCGASNGIDDKTIVTDMAGLSSWLTNQGLMLRRTRADVKRELPALQQIIHDLPADEHSLAMLADADILAATMLAGDIDRYTRGRVAAEFDMRLRQATGLAKAPYVAEFVRMLVSEGPVLLFGWHRACFAPGTLVLNHDGSTIPIESIKVGDKVMGPDSEPREVKSLVTGYGRMYRIVPNKGDEWVCSANHILTVWNCQAKRYEKWTADQFASRSPRWQRDRLLYRSEAVAFPAGEPVMEPWLLGYWLGDGASDLRDLRVLSADQEVIDECVAIAERHSLVLREYDAPGVTGKSRCKHLVFSLGSGHQRSGRYRNPLLQEFKTMGLVGNKHIPLKVLASSIADRWQVLAGLIDSDGHVCQGNGRGTAEINTVLPRLASDIARLARSLGLAAYVSISKFESSADPRFGRGSTRQRLYRVTISGDMTPLPTRIVRKAPLSTVGAEECAPCRVSH